MDVFPISNAISFSILPIIYIGFTLILSILSIYVLFLAIKALKIYIKNNS